jgi:hypothetical protein
VPPDPGMAFSAGWVSESVVAAAAAVGSVSVRDSN